MTKITHLLPYLSDSNLHDLELGLTYAQKNLRSLAIHSVSKELTNSVAEDERQKLLAELHRLNDGIADIWHEVGAWKLEKRVAENDSDTEVETAIDTTLEAIAEVCESDDRTQIRKALGIQEGVQCE